MILVIGTTLYSQLSSSPGGAGLHIVQACAMTTQVLLVLRAMPSCVSTIAGIHGQWKVLITSINLLSSI